MTDDRHLEPDAVVVLDAGAHPMDAVQRAAYRFSEVFTVELSSDRGSLTCRLFGRDRSRWSPQYTHDFRAEVVDQVLRARIRAETEHVRNLVLSVAFSRTGLSEAEAR
jgi:His-Xaa-Ser system protein HxsD